MWGLTEDIFDEVQSRLLLNGTVTGASWKNKRDGIDHLLQDLLAIIATIVFLSALHNGCFNDAAVSASGGLTVENVFFRNTIPRYLP